MTAPSQHSLPAIHNALWPGVVGKGDAAEPVIGFEEMLDLTASAEVDGMRFDGVDLFLTSPHVNIEASSAEIEALISAISARSLKVGSLVAPVWTPAGGGSAMGSAEDRRQFLAQITKACRIGTALKKAGIRRDGVIRIDSAESPEAWSRDPVVNTRRIVDTFRAACDIAAGHGERLAIEGEICWGGMHSWCHVLDLLEAIGNPDLLGFQADMAHVLLFALGYNAPEHRLLPEPFDWQQDSNQLDTALQTIANALRPWTIDFHVAQNDATVKGSGSHDKTGRHCLPNDPAGKLDIVRHSGYWLRDENGRLTRALKHICWDGCMFPNAVMRDPNTWSSILTTMIAVRDAHGWDEPAPGDMR